MSEAPTARSHTSLGQKLRSNWRPRYENQQNIERQRRGCIMFFMPQSLNKIIVHFVFSTKDRQPWIDARIIKSLHAYVATISRDMDCPTYRVGGVADHIHVAASLGRQVAPSAWIEHIKTESSRWIKTQGRDYSSFSWQRGYGAFSISPAHLKALLEYINGQAEHHQQETFQDEYRRLLNKYGLEYDEQYVWG